MSGFLILENLAKLLLHIYEKRFELPHEKLRHRKHQEVLGMKQPISDKTASLIVLQVQTSFDTSTSSA